MAWGDDPAGPGTADDQYGQRPAQWTAAERRGQWRHPAEETVGLFRDFVVHDGRVTGSITFGQTRLPVWAPYWPTPRPDDGLLDDWRNGVYPVEQWTEDAATLVRRLLDMRGEFARLLLTLANAEEEEYDRDEAETDAHFADRHPGEDVCACPDGPPMESWWEVDELRGPVVDQLYRCLRALGEDL